MIRILIAEDEEPIANLIRMNLTRAGYDCTWAADGMEAADLMQQQPFDLALLDIMLPGCNGYELLQYAQSMGLPVIFLTALGTTENKVKGLKMGADDYLVKPFAMEELVARVQVVLRRFHREEKIFAIDGVRVDVERHRVTRGGADVELTNREFELLRVLLVNRNIALSRNQLLDLAWGMDFFGDDRTVDVHIQRIRKKLGLEDYIKTVFKYGYRLEI